MSDQMTYFFEVYGDLPQAGPGNNIITARAYKMISNLPLEPKILDIGCGPGRQTLELARISGGKIIALDNHQPFLNKIKHPNVETLNQDMNKMTLPKDSFDLIWSEGALYSMGFENALKKCLGFLKKGGYLAASELVLLTDNPSKDAQAFAAEYAGIKNVPDNLELFHQNGYQVVGHFTLPIEAWLVDYYEPLQKKIIELRPKYRDNETATQVLNMSQQEIDGFKKCSNEVGYEFFVAQKT